MHRWFRFCALIALMAFSQGARAQNEETTVPIPKHRIKATAADLVQFHMDAQGKKIDELKSLLEAQTKQIEALTQLVTTQGKQIEAISERSELQTKQIETLNGDLNRLNANFLARASEAPAQAAAARPAPAYAGEPAVVVTPAVPVNPQANVAPAPPVDPNAHTHVVKQGETLISIARQHGVTVSELLKVNKIEDERKLQIGQTLVLPPTTPQKTDSH